MRYESTEEQKRASEIFDNAMRMGLMHGEEPMRAMAREIAQLEGWRNVNTKRLQEHHDLRAENDRLRGSLKIEQLCHKKDLERLEKQGRMPSSLKEHAEYLSEKVAGWSEKKRKACYAQDNVIPEDEDEGWRKELADAQENVRYHYGEVSDFHQGVAEDLAKQVAGLKADLEEEQAMAAPMRQEIKDLGDLVDALETTLTKTVRKHNMVIEQLKERTSDLDAINAARGRAVRQRDDARARLDAVLEARKADSPMVVIMGEVMKRARDDSEYDTVMKRIAYSRDYVVAFIEEIQRMDSR